MVAQTIHGLLIEQDLSDGVERAGGGVKRFGGGKGNLLRSGELFELFPGPGVVVMKRSFQRVENFSGDEQISVWKQRVAVAGRIVEVAHQRGNGPIENGRRLR